MERGKKAARDLLLEIRARANKWDSRDRAAGIASIAAMIAAAIPDAEPTRLGFLLVLADYLSSALSGFPPDPEEF